MGKAVINILQCSAVTQTALGGITISSNSKFLTVYMCQKLLSKLVGSRQSYCNSEHSRLTFLAHHLYTVILCRTQKTSGVRIRKYHAFENIENIMQKIMIFPIF